MRRIIEPITVWDGGRRVLEDAAVVIDDERISAVLTADDRASFDASAADEHIDGAGKLALPGLINAHTHLYSSLARGMTVEGFAPTSFSEILEQLWWRLDKALDREAVRASALVGAMEAARCGVTALADHHASPNAIPGSLDTLREIVTKDVGLRGVFCYETSDRDGLEKLDQGIEENVRFLREIESSDLQAGAQFGLHAAFTLSDASLERVAARLPDEAGVHIHVAEGPEDQEISLREHGIRVIDRLDRFGLLRPRSTLAHCLHLVDAEKGIVRDRDAIVVHNPRSNMNNAVGLFDLDGYISRGVLTGLGTDGLGCNMLGELFTAGLVQKHAHGDPLAGGFDRLNALLFRNNPAIIGRHLGVEVGLIKAGGPADVVLLDYVPPTPLTADNVLGHLLYGASVHSLRVSDLFVAGRSILRGGAFVEIDEQEAYAHAREAAHALWSRIE